jgi:hypothetical protein
VLTGKQLPKKYKLKNLKTAETFVIFFQATGEAFSPQKRTSSTSKN